MKIVPFRKSSASIHSGGMKNVNELFSLVGRIAIVLELEDRGFDVFAHLCDIARREQTQALAVAALERYGRVDIFWSTTPASVGALLRSMTG